MRNKYFYIYKVTNLITGKIYVGQRCSIVSPELDSKYIGSGVVISRSKKKHGIENFLKEILEICEIHELDSKEILWIKELDSMNPEVGYNLCEGGKGPKGYKHSPEQNAANSLRQQGKILSAEHKEKIRVGNTGKTISPENKQKFTERMTGRVKSPEEIEKRRKKVIGRVPWNKNMVMTEEQLINHRKADAAKRGKPSGRKGEPCPESVKAKLKEIWLDEEKLKEHSDKLKIIFSSREDVECPWCHKTGTPGLIHARHFDNCKQSPNYTPKDRPEIICPHCGRVGHTPAMYQKHFDKCPQNPDYKEPEKVILTCPHCGLVGGGNGTGSMKRWHYENCKLKPIAL